MSTSAVTAGPFRSLAGERVLFRCLLASIALHALVLLGISLADAPAPPAMSPPVLTAELAPLVAASPAPVPPQPRLAPSPLAQPALAPSPQSAEPAATPAPQQTALAEAAKASPAESAPAATGAAAPPAQPLAPAQTRPAPQAMAGIATADTAAKSGNEADKGTLEQYRLALIIATRRYKRYPAIAMEKGWQGRVEVHMAIGADGMIAGASIKSGSGHEVLDKQALEMLQRGKTAVPIPASLRGREFSIDVPVIFNLDSPSS
jgi:protein TonB